MGILNGPRINFWGGIETNVCVANNTDQIGGKDLLDLAASQASPNFTDEQIIAVIRTPDNGPPAYYTDGGWNYYGDYLVKFDSATVSSEGPAGAVSEGGDLAGQPVYLLGSIDPVTQQGPFFGAVMVDLDPTSSQTTQIVVGGLLIGSPNSPKLLIRYDTPCSSQSLGQRILQGEPDAPGSSTFNGTFQLTFPKESVRQYDHSSPTIAAIMTDPQATGFVLRFSMFEMAPLLTTPELVAAYGDNNNPRNPSVGRVIGTLGPKYADEPDTCPPGRLLINKSGTSMARPVGYAILDSTRSMLSIDTVSLMLKQKFRDDRKAITTPIGPNIDYGLIAVCTTNRLVVTPTGAAFDAQPDSYYKFGGIVDIPLTTEQIQAIETHPLTLMGTKDGNTVTIAEQPLRVYSNARNIYIDDLSNQQTEITCIVSHLGGPLNADTILPIVSSSSGGLPDANYLRYPSSVTVNAGQKLVRFSIADDGSTRYGFQCLTIGEGTGSCFVNFRKYQKTDFGIPAGTIVTWQQAYDNALRFYYVTFPAMSQRIPLNDMATIQATGDQIRARLSPPYHSTTLRMPITRCMSPSQVKLLDTYLAGKPWEPMP
jgi:hypothetical protein